MSLVGWVIVLALPVYAVVQWWAIERLGEHLELEEGTHLPLSATYGRQLPGDEADDRQALPAPDEATSRDGDRDRSRGWTPPSVTAGGVCRHCGTRNEPRYDFCQHCVGALG